MNKLYDIDDKVILITGADAATAARRAGVPRSVCSPQLIGFGCIWVALAIYSLDGLWRGRRPSLS